MAYNFQATVDQLEKIRHAMRCVKCSQVIRSTVFTLGQCSHRYCAGCINTNTMNKCVVCDKPSSSNTAVPDKLSTQIVEGADQLVPRISAFDKLLTSWTAENTLSTVCSSPNQPPNTRDDCIGWGYVAKVPRPQNNELEVFRRKQRSTASAQKTVSYLSTNHPLSPSPDKSSSSLCNLNARCDYPPNVYRYRLPFSSDADASTKTDSYSLQQQEANNVYWQLGQPGSTPHYLSLRPLNPLSAHYNARIHSPPTSRRPQPPYSDIHGFTQRYPAGMEPTGSSPHIIPATQESPNSPDIYFGTP